MKQIKGLLEAKRVFASSSAGKEFPCNAGDLGSTPGLGRSPGEIHGFPGGSAGKESAHNVGDLG